MGLGLEKPLHILIVLVVVLMLFGAKRLPEMRRGLGSGLREFRDSATGQQSMSGALVSDTDESD